MDRVTARAWALVALMVGSVLVAGIGVGTATAEEVTVEVSIVNQSGEPIGDATFTVTWDNGSTTDTTLPNGKRGVVVPDDKQLTIEVDADNYVRNEPYVTSTVSEGDTIEVSMYKTAVADITVRNDQGGVRNAEVTLQKRGTDQSPVINGTTNSDGTINSGFIEAGTYDLDVVKRGYLRNTTRLAVNGSTEKTMALEPASVAATINVVDNYYDPPRAVSNVSIEVGSIGTVTTLSNGKATIQVPVNSESALTLTKDGYRSVSGTLPVEEEGPSRTIAISRQPALKVEAGADRVVTGENTTIAVTDEYNDVVPNAEVSVNGESIGTTDAEGEIVVPIRSAGPQTVGVETGDASETITVTGFDPSTPSTTVPDTTTMEPTDGSDDDSSSAFGPGFGPLAALLALLAVALLARRRQ